MWLWRLRIPTISPLQTRAPEVLVFSSVQVWRPENRKAKGVSPGLRAGALCPCPADRRQTLPLSALFCSHPRGRGCCPQWGRQTSPLSPHSRAGLMQKHPHRHTQKQHLTLSISGSPATVAWDTYNVGEVGLWLLGPSNTRLQPGHHLLMTSILKKDQGLHWCSMAKTLPSNAGGADLIPDQGAKTPHTFQPKN